MREGTEDNSEIIFLISKMKKICCDPSLEPSRRDSSNGESENMFS